MKKIIFLLLVIGLMFSLSYAQAGIVPPPSGVKAVLAAPDTTVKNPALFDAVFTWNREVASIISWSEAGFSRGTAPTSGWGIGSGDATNYDNLWHVAERFTVADLLDMRAQDMEIYRMWIAAGLSTGSSIYPKTDTTDTAKRQIIITPHIFKNQEPDTLTGKMGIGYVLGKDFVNRNVLHWNLSDTPIWSGTPQVITDATYAWREFKVMLPQDTTGKKPALAEGAISLDDALDGELWLVFSVQFNNGHPFTTRNSAIDTKLPSGEPIGNGRTFRSFEPVGPDSILNPAFDPEEPEDPDDNPKMIVNPNAGLFTKFHDISVPEAHASNHADTNGVMPADRTNLQRWNIDWTIVADVRYTKDALAANKAYRFNADPDAQGTLAGFRVYWYDKDEHLTDAKLIGSYLNDDVAASTPANIVWVPTVPADTSKTPPTPAVPGYYKFVHANPTNNRYLDYGIRTIVDLDPDGTHEYIETAPEHEVKITVEKGVGQLPVPWLENFDKWSSTPLGSLNYSANWRLDNSRTTLRRTADSTAIATTRPVFAPSTANNWTFETSRPGYFQGASAVNVASGQFFEVDQYLISPALNWPKTTDIAGRKIYVFVNARGIASGIFTGAETQPEFSVYAGNTNVVDDTTKGKKLFKLNDETLTMTQNGWEGFWFELTANDSLMKYMDDNARFHVAVRHHQPYHYKTNTTAGRYLSLGLDDFYVGYMTPADFEKKEVTGFNATNTGGDVTLTWTDVTSASIMGYDVYRNGRFMARVEQGVQKFEETLVFNDDYTYYIQPIFGGFNTVGNHPYPAGPGKATDTKTITVTGVKPLVFAPVGFNAAYANAADDKYDVTLTWGMNDISTGTLPIRPVTIGSISGWSNSNSPFELGLANRYTAEDIAARGVAGKYIRSIEFMTPWEERVSPHWADGIERYAKSYDVEVFVYFGGDTFFEPADTIAVWTPENAELKYHMAVPTSMLTRSSSANTAKIWLNHLVQIPDSTDVVFVVMQHFVSNNPSGINRPCGFTQAGTFPWGSYDIMWFNGYWTYYGDGRGWPIKVDLLDAPAAVASGISLEPVNYDHIPAIPHNPPANPKQARRMMMASESNIQLESIIDVPAIPTYSAAPDSVLRYKVWAGLDLEGAGTTTSWTPTPITEDMITKTVDVPGYYRFEAASINLFGDESPKATYWYNVGPLTFDVPYENFYEDAAFPPRGWSTYSSNPIYGPKYKWERYSASNGGSATTYPAATTWAAGMRTPLTHPAGVPADTWLTSPGFRVPAIPADKDLFIEYSVQKSGGTAAYVEKYSIDISLEGNTVADFTGEGSYPIMDANDVQLATANLWKKERIFSTIDEMGDPVRLSDLLSEQEFYLGISYKVNSASHGINLDSLRIYIGEKVSTDDTPAPVIVTELSGNYPNPFNPTTTIAFKIAKEAPVAIEIFNIKGQKVKTLVNNRLEAGEYSVTWNGKDNYNKDVSTGIYFYRMKTDNYNKTNKMILLK